MNSVRHSVSGLALLGLCGCNLLLDLGQFDGATLVGSADSAGEDAAGDGGAWDHEGATIDSATDNESAADVPNDSTETGLLDANVPQADARDSAVDRTADEGEAATNDATGDAVSNEAQVQGRANDATAETAASDASTSVDGNEASTDGSGDATLDSSVLDASDGSPAPVMSFTWDEGTNLMGWTAHGWFLADGGAIGSCLETVVSTDGYPSPGCLAVEMPLTDVNQVVGISVVPGIYDISGRTISFYMKFDQPMTTDASPGGEGEFAINFSDVNWGWSITPMMPIPETALEGTWTQVSADVDTLSNVMNDAGGGGTNNPAQAQQMGIWISTAGVTGPVQAATVLIDSFTVQ